MLEHIGHRLLGVPHEDHGCLSRELLDAAGERAVGHVVLHDVNQRFVHLLVLAGELVEAHAIPIPHEADLSAGVADEKLGSGHLRSGSAFREARTPRRCGISPCLWGRVPVGYPNRLSILHPCPFDFGNAPSERQLWLSRGWVQSRGIRWWRPVKSPEISSVPSSSAVASETFYAFQQGPSP